MLMRTREQDAFLKEIHGTEVAALVICLVTVRLKALHRSGYSSVAGKLGPFFGRKDGARRKPQEKGIPRKLELRQRQYNTICRSLLTYNSNAYYIACAVTSNRIHLFLLGAESGGEKTGG